MAKKKPFPQKYVVLSTQKLWKVYHYAWDGGSETVFSYSIVEAQSAKEAEKIFDRIAETPFGKMMSYRRGGSETKRYQEISYYSQETLHEALTQIRNKDEMSEAYNPSC